ncbi:hypothetical protein AQJ11_37730 [Streptomyces corchorusii]|uniref:DNA primase/polymerase bifunctional N-terminal domain-containing protein n=2 Tax=Streptomyces TaxID=1883 RepID=A0A117QAI8_STRCK|nr:hypothetical protein [Streptomyces corchorusii]KUN17606.1 hypothetical protein AQJ11_37730 [Streptomyces corchorusii]
MLSPLATPAETTKRMRGHTRTPPCPPDPSEEASTVLGQAWRSCTPTSVPTGERFDLVRVDETLGHLALHSLRVRGIRCGAVFADHGSWHFFVPPGSAALPPAMDWPQAVTYLAGQHVTIPARGARAALGTALHWITRDPPGYLFTAPIPLWAALCAFTARPDTTITGMKR